MKKSLIAALALILATSAFAQSPSRRTVVVRDGKVITDMSDLAGRADMEMFFVGRSYIGVSLTNLSPELREHFGAPKDAGVMVESVQSDSPAEKAGIRVGDIILAADGKDVKSPTDLRRALTEKKEGDSVRIEALRGKARQTFVAAVKEREAPRFLDANELPRVLTSPEWKARLERLGGDCGDLQTRIKELETRLKDLEKKLNR
jgi:predicted metalloprotease with PDZ domain